MVRLSTRDCPDSLPEERYQQYQNADFGFIGIQAEAEMIQTRLGCETAGCQQHIGKQPTKGSPTVEYR
ncbi:MAG: hypothetical protein ABSC64_20565 [Candidatus Korobacteraceae bacterium]|jgi:hypothetical protein